MTPKKERERGNAYVVEEGDAKGCSLDLVGAGLGSVLREPCFFLIVVVHLYEQGLHIAELLLCHLHHLVVVGLNCRGEDKINVIGIGWQERSHVMMLNDDEPTSSSVATTFVVDSSCSRRMACKCEICAAILLISTFVLPLPSTRS